MICIYRTDKFFRNGGPVSSSRYQTKRIHQSISKSSVDPITCCIFNPTFVFPKGIIFGGPNHQVLKISPCQIWAEKKDFQSLWKLKLFEWYKIANIFPSIFNNKINNFFYNALCPFSIIFFSSLIIVKGSWVEINDYLKEN